MNTSLQRATVVATTLLALGGCASSLVDTQWRSVELPASYLRGSHAILFVVDGTRRETFDQLSELQELARAAAGEVPSLVALNKADLAEQWVLGQREEAALAAQGRHLLKTSAKSGAGVEAAFSWLARETIRDGGSAS